ncbi:hypothetical protein SAMN06265360_102238 [Haloechinothrix alba]|uniref:LVIVD repeat-containing protein n=1 Tax=Haloechinothrix alba TaxID=664784 RepID=A0A238VGV7_9PSEU|nr:selenium-binding family protein [Haloechinothrix alba]SNR33441.1 hypothetical protein SAMN06265360_102238 [Haloechinothrix alba]
MPATRRRLTPAVMLAAALLASASLLVTHPDADANVPVVPTPADGEVLVKDTDAYGEVLVSTSRVQGNGQLTDQAFTVTNHVVSEYAQQGTDGKPQEYLLVWAGDENAADTAVHDAETLPDSLLDPVNKVKNASVGPDFLAVIDVTEGSPSYGKLVNTATVGPLVSNEPHHMQYTWSKGDTVFAGGLFNSMTYAFDVSDLPEIKLKGVSTPVDTPGGSVPDAYSVLEDGTAYATYMGGPVLPGPHRYSDGSVRTGNGYAGSPGEVVRFDENGNVLSESPAATSQGGDPEQCKNIPQVDKATCANPHGIQVREDLDTMVTGDFVEPRTLILDPIDPPSPYLFRSTVRIWDISDRNHPKVTSVQRLPDDPQEDPEDPRHRDSSGLMEVTVTQQPEHKGAFAQTMQGGAIYYAPDITAQKLQWRKVWDDGDALKAFHPSSGSEAADTNGGWIQTSANDQFLYHTIMGREKGALGSDDPGAPGGMISLDISKLVNAENPRCDLHSKPKGKPKSADCPTLAGAAGINRDQPGKGPHFGTVDNFELGPDGKYRETDQPDRLAGTDYFVARAGHRTDHKLWVTDVGENGELSVDDNFRDEATNSPGWDFNRDAWPHGPFGNAKPHKGLFVVADQDVE